jgi:hypothetical protein
VHLFAILFKVGWVAWCVYLTMGAAMSYSYLGRILRRQPVTANRMTALIQIIRRGQRRRIVRSMSLAIVGVTIWPAWPGSIYVTILGLVFLFSIIDESYSFIADNHAWKVIGGTTQE